MDPAAIGTNDDLSIPRANTDRVRAPAASRCTISADLADADRLRSRRPRPRGLSRPSRHGSARRRSRMFPIAPGPRSLTANWRRPRGRSLCGEARISARPRTGCGAGSAARCCRPWPAHPSRTPERDGIPGMSAPCISVHPSPRSRTGRRRSSRPRAGPRWARFARVEVGCGCRPYPSRDG